MRNVVRLSLVREERAYQELLDFPGANPNPVMRVNKLGVLLYANPSSQHIMMTWKIGLNEKLPAEWREIIRQVIQADKPQEIEMKSGELSFLLNIVPIHGAYVSIFGLNMTTLKAVERELKQLTTTDTVTKLPNRVIFSQNLAMEINHAKSIKAKMSIFILRLDDYFEILNSYGQEVTEAYLLEFCNRLQIFTVNESTIARISDNEFGMISPQIRDASQAASYIQALIEITTVPYQVLEKNIFTTLSVGICFYPNDGDTSDVLTRNAQLAVNRTSSTRNQYEFFQRGMIDQLQIKRNIISDLHNALENNEFVLFYQPQINLKTQTMVSCESLIRWNHPEKGFISPFFFMTAAEETHLIVPIGEWVLRAACIQAKNWQNAGCPPIKVAVNVSARQLFQTDIVALVRYVLKETQLSPQWLEIELTESVLAQDMNLAIEIMKDLKALGVDLALDDFGTGYSSLSYLMQFQVDKLKIDRSFIKGIEDATEGHALTRGIIDLGHSINLKVIAEGVETKAQLQYLKQHNCDLIQGYYFAQPQPADKFEEFFRKNWNA
ncbi:MAG TPA: GGDEF domain-containing phosphodiesterase [Candidatus Berkiella sp.]|nr:GGDEF domain-containing phosphodiesterase [Candidatus Berkiella sp.]